MRELWVLVHSLWLCPYFFTSVEVTFIIALCLQGLTSLTQRAPSRRGPCSSLLKCFKGFITIWVNGFVFVSVALMHIYVTLGTRVKRYTDQPQDVKNQLHENVSIRTLVLFIGCVLCQPYSSPAHSWANVKQFGQLLLSDALELLWSKACPAAWVIVDYRCFLHGVFLL